MGIFIEAFRKILGEKLLKGFYNLVARLIARIVYAIRGAIKVEAVYHVSKPDLEVDYEGKLYQVKPTFILLEDKYVFNDGEKVELLWPPMSDKGMVTYRQRRKMKKGSD